MIRELEEQMWKAACARDSAAFLKLVDSNAVMVCGGYRCTGAEYAQIISQFDCSAYEITGFETAAQTDSVVQVHYVIKTEVGNEENRDLAGSFHITSTWEKRGDTWKLIFNMDSRILA